MTIFPLGDSAVVVQFADVVDEALAVRVRAVVAAINRQPLPGLTDVVPAFASIAIFFDPVHAPSFPEIEHALAERVRRAETATVPPSARVVEVPVCYAEEFAPDIGGVAAHCRMTIAEVIARHAGPEYLVHAIGFVPGFPYLGGLPVELATPRRDTPRQSVPAGSVGIGGAQTGIYPFATPGGWNLIGRTPLRLFDAHQAEPALLRAGDRVKFRPISPTEYAGINADAAAGEPARLQKAPPTEPTIEVLRAGLFTTVQDIGRHGHRAHGVPLGGAADVTASRIANALVGNAEDAAVLEFTLIGPDLRFSHDTVVALGGAEFAGLPRWRPVKVAAGTEIKFGPARTGCRGYLAVAGGIAVASLLGSRSTYVRAGLGGFAGRALIDGDRVPVRTIYRRIREHWRIDERILPAYSDSPVVRIVAGAHRDRFTAEWLERSFRVSSHSDRMGVRLIGEPVGAERNAELLSAPVAPGTIQVPRDGQLIILLADAQTVGGYPQLAHVISIDLPQVAQLRPGEALRFRLVSLDHARELWLARERALGLLREGLASKLA